MGRRRRRGHGRRGEGVGVCSGVGTVLCRVPHVAAAGVGVDIKCEIAGCAALRRLPHSGSSVFLYLVMVFISAICSSEWSYQ